MNLESRVPCNSLKEPKIVDQRDPLKQNTQLISFDSDVVSPRITLHKSIVVLRISCRTHLIYISLPWGFFHNEALTVANHLDPVNAGANPMMPCSMICMC